MVESSSVFMEPLPLPGDKDLLAMNQLMADKRYRIKQPSNFLMPDRTDKVNPDFILYTLNDYLGHIQKCVASTKKMLPFDEKSPFFEKFRQTDNMGFRLITLVRGVDLKNLSSMLLKMQKTSYEVTVAQLVPFVHLLFQFLIRVYYLDAPEVAKKYKATYALIMRDLVPADPVSLKDHTTSAIEEWYYIYDSVCPGLYPLVLRMCSAEMLTQHQLFYQNGSRVLAWLHVLPSDVIIRKHNGETQPPVEMIEPQKTEPVPEREIKAELPEGVQEGLDILDQLFPEAGWKNIDTLPDMCPYFLPILEFNDGFSQLAPDNPLQHTLILLAILEELFQGLRLIKFLPMQPTSHLDEVEDINKILEDWILYLEIIFNKNFYTDLKEYTHQIYTQPEYNKSPYGRMLLSNMYTLIKATFLPFFDIRLFGIAKVLKDDRLPPFYLRVMRLKRLMGRYCTAINTSLSGKDDSSSSIIGVQNPWDTYKFDIANPVSKRLNAICGGKNSKNRTNALLIQYTNSILLVLDWWINDRESPAYARAPDYLYRVNDQEKSVPVFSVKSRTDVETIFLKHLKTRNAGLLSDK